MLLNTILNLRTRKAVNHRQVFIYRQAPIYFAGKLCCIGSYCIKKLQIGSMNVFCNKGPSTNYGDTFPEILTLPAPHVDNFSFFAIKTPLTTPPPEVDNWLTLPLPS